MRPCPDTFVFLCGAHMDQVMRLDAPAIMGSSNPARITLSPGGAALNAASIAAASGLDSILVSPVGNDTFAAQLRECCHQRGITEKLVVSPGETGIYAALFNPDGNIVIGAAGLAIYDNIGREWLNAHLTSFQNMQTGILVNANLSSDLLEMAASGFGFVAAATISPSKAPRLLPLLDRFDILFANRREAMAILDAGPNTVTRELAARLRQAGSRCGVISDGANALWWWDEDHMETIAPPTVTNMVDVNGAGDALSGATLALLASGLPLGEALAGAVKIAAATLAHAGPLPEHAPAVFQSILEGN